MTYDEALNYIWGTPSPGEDRLNVLEKLLKELKNPQLGLNYIHVAGTNGKGSTSAYLSSIMREAGYKTGLYISPHIHRINERIQINGRPISNADLAEITTEVAKFVDKMDARPTIFSLITAIAYIYFKRKGCEVVVLEAGIGGRLDATNIIESSAVSVITNIGFDHTETLGDTLPAIAAEKAGIIKENGNVALYKQGDEVMKVFEDTCRERNASFAIADGDAAKIKSLTIGGTVFDYGEYKDLKIQLPGLYQVKNAVTAITAVAELRKKGWWIEDSALKRGLNKTKWPGRFEVIREKPCIIVDGTHNPQGTAALMESLAAIFPGKEINFVIGVLADKDYIGSVKLAAPLAKRFYAVSPGGYRALPPEALATEIEKLGKRAEAFESIPDALTAVMGDVKDDDIICVFGTLYQIHEIQTFFKEFYSK